MKEVIIGNKKVGGQNPCFVAVDVGSNHNKSMDKAKELIDAASKSGADAVKFQTNPADQLYSKSSPKFDRDPVTPYELIKQVMWPDNMQHGIAEKELSDYCKKKGIMFFTTPVGKESTDWIAEIVPMIKIASFEADAHDFLRYTAAKKKPMILSTGARYMDEVEDAVDTIVSAGNKDLVILHCTSNYPSDPKEANLRAIETIAKKSNHVAGYSDHIDMYDSIVPRLGQDYEKAGIISGALAALFGAKFLEKHFTLTRKFRGPDSTFAIEPEELKDYIKILRDTEKRMNTESKEEILNEFLRGYKFTSEMIGDGLKKPVPREFGDPRRKGQRYLYFSKDVLQGAALTEKDVCELRGTTDEDPIKPKYAYRLKTVFEKKLVKPGKAGTCITWGHFGIKAPLEVRKYL